MRKAKLSVLLAVTALLVLVLCAADKSYKTLNDFLKEARSVVVEISPLDASAKLGEEGVVFLDVREPDEVKKGKIPGAVNIPRGLLEFKIEKMYPDRDAQFFIVYCAAGGRGLLASKTLQEMGYNVMNIKGGFSAWTKEGLPVEK